MFRGASSWQLGTTDLYLFVSYKQMGPEAKRDRIAQIWPASAGNLLDSTLLSDESLAGIARPGTAYMTKMPDELGYLLTIIDAFKHLPQDRRERLLSDPWMFGEWIEEQPGSDRRAFRHTLLYLCFPETYERISSWRADCICTFSMAFPCFPKG